MIDNAADYLASFQRRVVQEALTSAHAHYWARRAAVFEWARPRQSDFYGIGNTPERVHALDERICATRDACLVRANLAPIPEDIPTEEAA